MTQYLKTALSHNKLRLIGKHTELQPDIYAGNPQLVVWSKAPSEEGKTDSDGNLLHNRPIKASTSWPRLRSMLLDLETLYGKTEKTVRVMECLTVDRSLPDSERMRSRVRQALVLYGRDGDGFLFIEVRVEGREAARVLFAEDSWHNDMGANKLPRPNAEYSDMIAKGMIASWIDVYASLFVSSFDPNFKTKAQREKEEKQQREAYQETPTEKPEPKEAQADPSESLGW